MTTQQAAIVQAAIAALTDPNFETRAGYCQRFARQVIQKCFHARFDSYWRETADATRRAFIGSKYYHLGLGYGEAGDLIYFAGSGNMPAGHVMINIGGGFAVQNSITDMPDETSGYKGRKDLATVRTPTAVVRLWS